MHHGPHLPLTPPFGSSGRALIATGRVVSRLECSDTLALDAVAEGAPGGRHMARLR